MRSLITGCLVVFCIIFSGGEAILAQNAPQTFAQTVGGVTPGTVTVAITVANFNNVGAISLSLDYDYSVLHYVSSTPHSQLPTFIVGDNNLGTGYHRLNMGWYGQGTSLSNGSTIMTLTFSYISGITSLTWFDIGPSCEYADGNYNVLNDIPTSDYYFNGFVCGQIGTPGAISGLSEVCQGTTDVVYSLDPVTNATGYTWTVPGGSEITTGTGTNTIMVSYSDTAVSGNVTVTTQNQCGNGPSAQIAVTVNPLPIAYAGEDLSIPYGTSTTLSAASGGSGSFTYAWSPAEFLINPYSQNPQTVNLTETTIFTLLVTNATTGCQEEDDMMVSVYGGPLSVSPIAIPNPACEGETVELFSMASGGSENYTYSWTSNPEGFTSTLANPVITADISRLYIVQVDDGFNNQVGYVSLTVNDLPTATISGGDTLCGEAEFTTLQVDFTGTPPWSFTYSWGSTSVYITNQQTTPYTIVTNEAGDYSITYIQNGQCPGLSYGLAMVRKFPIPAKPEITIYFSELISSSCCGNQWYFNDQIIAGATGQTYQVTETGQYYVIVTINGCTSEPSDPVDIIVGITENRTEAIKVYPNPASDRIFIEMSGSVEGPIAVKLYSIVGELVKEERGWTMDVRGVAEGVYFLRMESAARVCVRKVVVR